MVAGMRRVWQGAVAGVVLAGCSGSPSMLDTHGSNARRIAALWWLMFGLAVVVAVVVLGLVVAAIRHRADPGAEPDAVGAPDDRRDHRFIVIGGLAVPAVVLGVVAVGTVRTTNALLTKPGALTIEVTGERWWWRVTYPSLGVTTANEIHVPVGTRVDVRLTSDDVIHSFWVPQLSGKVDLIPGQVNHLAVDASSPGTYLGLCAEFCGIAHALMQFQVVADPPAAFDAWVTQQRAGPAAPGAGDAATGATLLTTMACAGCHAVAGTAAQGTLGPDLSHVGSRSTLAAGTLPNTAPDMTRWLTHTQDVKPGALMPQLDLTSDEVRALVAYLEGLK
jgi:cytochrome c oxidase subunit II